MPTQQEYKKMSVAEFSSHGEKLQRELHKSLQDLQRSSSQQLNAEYNKLRTNYLRWHKALEKRFPKYI